VDAGLCREFQMPDWEQVVAPNQALQQTAGACCYFKTRSPRAPAAAELGR